MLDKSDLPSYIIVDPNYPIINIGRVEFGVKMSLLITGTLSDGTNSSEQININILPINRPPYFDKNLTNITLIAGDSFSYKLPCIFDLEDDKV